MTHQVLQFVAGQGNTGKTLEVGSRDINGSLRNYYPDYTGVDTIAGGGVDIVVDGKTLPFEDGTFDRVLYLEVMEHDLFFWNTINEMRRVLKPGGKLIVTTRNFQYPRHDYPADYYRFSGAGIGALLDSFGFKEILSIECEADNGVHAWGVKN